MFIGVSNNDTVADGEQYAREFAVPYALANAPDVWALYDDPFRPTTILINAEGSVASHTTGPVTYEGLKTHIESVL